MCLSPGVHLALLLFLPALLSAATRKPESAIKEVKMEDFKELPPEEVKELNVKMLFPHLAPEQLAEKVKEKWELFFVNTQEKVDKERAEEHDEKVVETLKWSPVTGRKILRMLKKEGNLDLLQEFRENAKNDQKVKKCPPAQLVNNLISKLRMWSAFYAKLKGRVVCQEDQKVVDEFYFFLERMKRTVEVLKSKGLREVGDHEDPEKERMKQMPKTAMVWKLKDILRREKNRVEHEKSQKELLRIASNRPCKKREASLMGVARAAKDELMDSVRDLLVDRSPKRKGTIFSMSLDFSAPKSRRESRSSASSRGSSSMSALSSSRSTPSFSSFDSVKRSRSSSMF